METALRIADIVLDFHGRAAINDPWVETLAEVLDGLPPPRVLRDAAGVLRAVDGVHTLLAAAKKGHTEWPCDVREGTEDEAREAAAKANLDAGNPLPLTNADKRHRVKLLLISPTWRGRTDGVVAEIVGVTPPFVGKVRDELTRNGFESPRVRIDKNGRPIDTSDIGKDSLAADALGFVAHALSNGRDAYLTIAGGRVLATSRALTASAPFLSPFDFQPKASEFIAAVGRTGASWRLLPDGSVVVERAGLAMRVPVTTAPAPGTEPSGTEVRVGSQLLPTLQRLSPWSGDKGILFTPARAYAWNGWTAASLDLTEPLFDAILRLPPEAAHVLVTLGESRRGRSWTASI